MFCFPCWVLQLLDHEVHAREQVPLLIEMKKADLALDKAIESGDPQLGNCSMFMHYYPAALMHIVRLSNLCCPSVSQSVSQSVCLWS